MTAAPTSASTSTSGSRSDYINLEEEDNVRKAFINIAFADSDATWTKHQTNDKRIQVDYKQISGNMTTRGRMNISGDIHQYYVWAEGGFLDIYANPSAETSEVRIDKCVDLDHQVIYASYKSPAFMVSARDFCYFRTRFEYADYAIPGQTEPAYICGTFCYSIPESHAFHVQTKAKHVRGTIKYSGHVMRQISETEFEAIYVVCMDPGGWIPAVVLNQQCGKEGMKIQKMSDKWLTSVVRKVQLRRDNNFKRDIEPMFQIPENANANKAQKNNNNNNNSNAQEEAEDCDVNNVNADPENESEQTQDVVEQTQDSTQAN